MVSLRGEAAEYLDTPKKDKIYWHDAFFEALQLELHQYLEALKFINEHPLNKEALIVDVLVIKKEHDIDIEKNIGKIFRTINLFEFKSETEFLTVRDYNKVMGYGYFYASFAPVDISDITLSFAVTVHPRDLLDYLENTRGFNVKDTGEGIYHIEGDTFPVQILESKKLSPEKNLFLKNLRSNLSTEEARRIVEAYKELKAFEKKNAYIDRLVKANPDVFKEALDLSDTAVREMVAIALAEESGLLKDRDLENAKKFAKKLLQRGDTIDEVVQITELPLEIVKTLA